jgi:hypothetical protein
MSGTLATMVVLIVLIVTIGKVLSKGHQVRGRLHEAAGSDADTARLQGEIRQLKERIAVLERVVTENHGSIGLDREIERLRDR